MCNEQQCYSMNIMIYLLVLKQSKIVNNREKACVFAVCYVLLYVQQHYVMGRATLEVLRRYFCIDKTFKTVHAQCSILYFTIGKNNYQIS